MAQVSLVDTGKSCLQTHAMETQPLYRAIEIVGLRAIAQTCCVRYQAVQQWRDRGCLPRTEYTGETNYAETIERLTEGQVTAEELLSARRRGRARTGPKPAIAPPPPQP